VVDLLFLILYLKIYLEYLFAQCYGLNKGEYIKAVILAGGLGTRLSEETSIRPKPMVEIGGIPILWHIMKIYSHYGFNEFIICLGYKGYMIKEYFSNYFIHMSDITVDLKSNDLEILNNKSEPWRVTMVDTGVDTMTGGRLKRVKKYVEGGTFMMTYGDGLIDLDINKLVRFHREHEVKATLTAVKPAGRWGLVEINPDGIISEFAEKPRGDGGYVNGGFFVLEPSVFDYIENDSTIWERGPLENMAREKVLAAYKHDGFWYAMDTQRDKLHLEEKWSSGNASWKVW
jgi:glucose-1-phosphate cytidylyltransferase